MAALMVLKTAATTDALRAVEKAEMLGVYLVEKMAETTDASKADLREEYSVAP